MIQGRHAKAFAELTAFIEDIHLSSGEQNTSLVFMHADFVYSHRERITLFGVISPSVHASLAPRTHEEEDTRKMLHVADALRHSQLICTVGSDAVVLAVNIYQKLEMPLIALWVIFGTGEHMHMISAHNIPASIVPERLYCTAITECDTVSYFVGSGKKTAWNT